MRYRIAKVGSLFLFVSACRTGPAPKPEAAQMHYQIGVGYLGEDRFPEALTEFQTAQKLDPSDALFELHVGLAYLKLERLDDALKHVASACQRLPELPECWNNLAAVHLARREYPQTVTAAQKALSFDTYGTPESAEFHQAAALLAQKNYPAARAAAERGLKAKADDCLLRKLVIRIAARARQWPRAADESARGVIYCRADAGAYLWKAYTSARLGRLSEAETEYRRAADLFRQPAVVDASRAALERMRRGLPPEEPSL